MSFALVLGGNEGDGWREEITIQLPELMLEGVIKAEAQNKAVRRLHCVGYRNVRKRDSKGFYREFTLPFLPASVRIRERGRIYGQTELTG